MNECSGENQRNKDDQTDRFRKMREKMVENQIRARGIKDKRVLEAVEEVPRHLFVPEDLKERAYGDEPLPIGSGQTISQPYIVAYMTEQLDLQPEDKVLEVGTGSGYQAAILSRLVDSVYTIEILPELSQKAQQVISELGYSNIFFKVGNGFYGWPEHAPYDAIIVTAAPENIPDPLVEQLKEGGEMIIPVGDYFQDLFLLKKEKGKIKKQKKLPVRFVPLQGEP
ncbi:MAG: protein-L-isoaspartate(D-aspartate) O-methyltransferase [Calditrichaeota bacterium]|nr:protein-L-isoaspartate(D-aspartate) O-methyltransferase [Calditrichota bacterium]